MNRKSELLALALSMACLNFSMAQDAPADPPEPAPATLPDSPPTPDPASPNNGDPAPAPADAPKSELPEPQNGIPADPQVVPAPGQIPAKRPSVPAPEIPGNPSVPAGLDDMPPAPPEPDAVPVEEPAIKEKDGKIRFKATPMNEVLSYLADQAGYGYMHNTRLAGPEFEVTGSLPSGDPYASMKMLAKQHNLDLYLDGNTVFTLDQSQITQLPSQEWTYQLRYLRPSDIEALKALIQPLLTPNTGIINFEPKTNTIVIIDSVKKTDAVQRLMDRIDRAKGQIIIDTKILRANAGSGKASGIDWTSTLGRNSGLSLDAFYDLNELFNLGSYNGPYQFTGSGFNAAAGGGAAGGAGGAGGAAGAAGAVALGGVNPDSGAGIVLSPTQFTGILRALRDANVAKQESNPTLITEDNEQAIISIIDRVPIITQSNALSAGASQQSEEVRYTIDESDPTIATDPTNTREIGVTVSVTPTMLPDNTVRMKLRPRAAQVVEFIQGSAGNEYPRVNESTIDTISRVPNGHTLLLGGFYNIQENKENNKIPLLGDIPIINFLFKSNRESNDQTSLVFAVTPKAYDPANVGASDAAYHNTKNRLELRDGATDYFNDEDKVKNQSRPHSSSAKDAYYREPAYPSARPKHLPSFRR